MSLKFAEYKNWLIFGIVLILIDGSIIFNIPFYRQTLGFIFLTIIPGALLVSIFNLTETENLVKSLLTIGLSLSFVLIFGLYLNNLLLAAGYNTPLSTISILVSFNIMYVLLVGISYVKNKGQLIYFSRPNLSTSEKLFLIVPIFFPALSVLGTYVMNKTGNNDILIFLFLLIAVYIIFVCNFHKLLTNKICPIIIFLMSISLLLLLPLRSDHIIGSDSHAEYYLFRANFDHLSWSTISNTTLDSCLSISLFPIIYQSILNIESEFLFKILYSLIYSIAPVIVYTISKKYVEISYAFLASVFFMSQQLFIYTEANARTTIAILFFAFSMLVLFSDQINREKRKFIFIIFMISCLLSHYTTTYIFFFILLLTYLMINAISFKYRFSKNITFTTIVLFFILIFFWYSTETKSSFENSVYFFENTFVSLNNIFINETMSSSVSPVLGTDLSKKGVAYLINFISNWAAILLIGVGIIASIVKYKEVAAFEAYSRKAFFLEKKIDTEYLIIAIICTGILFLTIVVPYLTQGYEYSRIYAVMVVILAVFFVIGGIVVSNKLNTNAHLFILLILIPYFLANASITYAIFDEPQFIVLSSDDQYNTLYIHDQEIFATSWLKEKIPTNVLQVYTDDMGQNILMSQGLLKLGTNVFLFEENKSAEGYIYLRYQNVVHKKLYRPSNSLNNMYYDQIVSPRRNKIYDNAGSNVYL